jgi:hypothetical protein
MLSRERKHAEPIGKSTTAPACRRFRRRHATRRDIADALPAATVIGSVELVDAFRKRWSVECKPTMTFAGKSLDSVAIPL